MPATVGNTTAYSDALDVAVQTFSHVHNGDTLVVCTGSANGGGITDPTGVTFGGVAMTKTASATTADNVFNATQWKLVTGPATANVVVTYGASVNFPGHCAISLSGINPTTPNRTGAGAFGNANQNASVSPTTSAGDVIIVGGTIFTTVSITSGGSQTRLQSIIPNANGTISSAFDSAPGGTSPVTMTGGGGTNDWAITAVSYIAATVAATNVVEDSARPRPGRGPFSTRAKGFRVSNIDAYQMQVSAALQGNAVDTANATGDLTTQPNIAQTDWGQSRNRPGRGPLSTGRFFLPSIDAFTQPTFAALQGAASDLVTAAAALSTAINLAGAATDTATATANLTTAIRLAVSAIANANATGALTTAIVLGSNASDVATAAGNLTTQIQLVGAAIDTALATGSITGGALLSGAAQAVATVSGSLTTVIQLLGSASDQALAAGSLTTGIKLSGSASDIATATGSLASNAAALIGAAQSIVTALGILTTGISLTGNASAVANASAAMLTSIRLFGAASGVAVASGILMVVSQRVPNERTVRAGSNARVASVGSTSRTLH